MPTYNSIKTNIRAAVRIIDAEGEYVAGDSFARIAVIDARIAIKIEDRFNNPATIEVEVDESIVFSAIAHSSEDFEVEIHIADEWESILFE